MKEEFIELLRSTKREGIENLLNFLEKSDFYTAPASTRFHGNYEGGLLEHSMKVYEIFKEKIKASGLSTPEDTIIIAPLLHDICKTNYYKVDYRNAKNARGEWEKVPYYAVEDTIPYGHGEKSVMMITEYMKLTNEEIEEISVFTKTMETELESAEVKEFILRYREGLSVEIISKATGDVPKSSRT